MFKWDRLLRRDKLHKRNDYVRDETEGADLDLYTEGDMPDDPVKNEDENEEEYEIVELEILPNKIICPDCGGITLEGIEFCDKCGGEL